MVSKNVEQEPINKKLGVPSNNGHMEGKKKTSMVSGKLPVKVN